MKNKLIKLFLVFISPIIVNAQRIDTRIREYFPPVEIVWTSSSGSGRIVNSEALMKD